MKYNNTNIINLRWTKWTEMSAKQQSFSLMVKWCVIFFILKFKFSIWSFRAFSFIWRRSFCINYFWINSMFFFLQQLIGWYCYCKTDIGNIISTFNRLNCQREGSDYIVRSLALSYINMSKRRQANLLLLIIL